LIFVQAFEKSVESGIPALQRVFARDRPAGDSPDPASIMSPPPLDIIILGGSYAGLAVAHNFLDKIVHQLSTFEGAPIYRIVIVSPFTHVYWNLCAPRALVSPSLIHPEDAFMPIRPALARHVPGAITFVHGWATGIDTSARKVMVEQVTIPEEDLANSKPEASSTSAAEASESSSVPPNKSHCSNAAHRSTGKIETLRYHALVLATGSSTPSPIFSLHGGHAETLAELHALHLKIESAHSVLIVGGGPTGVETAGQLATHYNQCSRWKTFKTKRLRPKATTHPHALTRAPKVLVPPLEGANKDKEKRGSTDSASTASGQDASLTEIAKHDSGISAQVGTAHAKFPTPLSPPHTHVPKTVTLVSGSTRLLPDLSPSLSAKTEKMLKKQGVHIIHHVREVCHTVNADGSTRCILNNNTSLTADVHISATGTYPNTNFLPKELVDRNGFVKTNPRTLRVEGRGIGERVYAIGDCASYSRGSLADVYRAVPVLMENLKTDLLEFELRLQTVAAVPPSTRTARLVSALESGVNSRYGNAARTVMLKEVVPQFHAHCSPPPPASLSPIKEDVPHVSSPRMRTTTATATASSTSPGRPSLLTQPLLTPEDAAQKRSALEDAHYTQLQSDTYLMPTSRFGGVGVIWGIKVPGWAVYLLKGRTHRLDKAKRAVEEGTDPYRVTL